jgi:hypothetical protein
MISLRFILPALSCLLLSLKTSQAVPMTMTNALGGVSSGGNFTIGNVWPGGVVVQYNLWPATQTASKAIDGVVGSAVVSKYLNLNQLNAGLIVTPDAASAAFALDGLSFHTANDVVGRDPASYQVYGSPTVLSNSTPGTVYPLTGMTLLGSGSLTLPDARNNGPAGAVSFPNARVYASYLIVFPTVKAPAYVSTTTNSVQISEIYFNGSLGVTNTVDSGPGSLRAALATAASLPGPNEITFDPAVFHGATPETNTITLTSAELVVNDTAGVTINAMAIPGGVTLNGANAFRLFLVGSESSLTLRGLTITGGVGQAVRTHGALTVTDCNFTRNGSAFRGGAIGAESGSSLNALRCTFTENSADYGGAVSFIATNGPLTFTYCTFVKNTANIFGGAIRSSGFTGTAVTLIHCTLSANHARSGGGAINYDSNPSFDLINTVVAGTTAPSGPVPAIDIFKQSPRPLTATGCLIGNGQGTGLVHGEQGNLIGSSAAPVLPLTGPLGFYGGRTPTLFLKAGSPARNAGILITPALTSDQRGFPIIGLPDIGAYETGTFTGYPVWINESLPATAAGADYDMTSDFDQDGLMNFDEFSYLTDPANALSAFQPETTRSGGSLTITFPTVPGRTYTLQQSDNLTDWINSSPAPLAGNGAVRTFNLPGPQPDRRFFRVRGAP